KSRLFFKNNKNIENIKKDDTFLEGCFYIKNDKDEYSIFEQKTTISDIGYIWSNKVINNIITKIVNLSYLNYKQIKNDSINNLNEDNIITSTNDSIIDLNEENIIKIINAKPYLLLLVQDVKLIKKCIINNYKLLKHVPKEILTNEI